MQDNVMLNAKLHSPADRESRAWERPTELCRCRQHGRAELTAPQYQPPAQNKKMYNVQCESKKSPSLKYSDIFSQNGWEFLIQILHAYYMFISTLDYKFLFNYLQL